MKNYSRLNAVLKKRYDEHRLANLYILRYNSKTTNPDAWVKEFLSNINITQNDHPDILTIKRSEEENDYKVDGAQWGAFQNFLQYRPYVLKNKFVFIHDAHRISDILSNKLLKTFEDSPKDLTIFLLLKDQQSLLPTIFSRGITLQILSPLEKTIPPHINFHETPAKISLEIKSLDDGESAFISSVIDETLEKSPTFLQTSQLLDNLRAYEKSAEFNNAQTSRIALILP